MIEWMDAVWVLAGGVVSMAIGMLWYSPVLFGKAWMELSGCGPEKIAEAKAKGMGKTYFLAFLNGLVMSAAIYYLAIWATETVTVQDAVILAAVLWLGFIATTLFSSVLWEQKPLKLYFIKTGCSLVTMILVSILYVLTGNVGY